MTRNHQRRLRTSRNRALKAGDPKKELDLFFALDRRLVEFSMSVYNIPASERFKMREQNRRLHQAVRDHVELVRKRF